MASSFLLGLSTSGDSKALRCLPKLRQTRLTSSYRVSRLTEQPCFKLHVSVGVPRLNRIHVVCRKADVAAAPSNGAGGKGAYIGKFGTGDEATRASALPSLETRLVFISLAVAMGLPVLGGMLVAGIASPLQDWYKELDKPAWEPPEWFFGTVWSLLYVVMGLASWLVWAHGGWEKQAGPLKLYLLKLAVNFLWPITFFRMHLLFPSFLVSCTLLFLTHRTMMAFYAVNQLAGWLFIPYLAWVAFATYFSFVIWQRNKDNGDFPPGTTWSASVRPKEGGDW